MAEIPHNPDAQPVSPEPSIPTPTPSLVPKVPQAPASEIPIAPTEMHPAVHTLQSDLDRIMTATDPARVQEMLTNARENEAYEKDELDKGIARTWLSKGALILVFLALIGIGYGIVYYTRLTVPVEDTGGVGVFPSTLVQAAQTTSITDALTAARTDQTLEDLRPALVPIVTDTTSETLLTPTQLFAYIGGAAPEPLIQTLSVLRIGVVQIDSEVIPFIIGATTDLEVTAKELQNAEPQLVTIFARALAIDQSTPVGGTFTSGYRYNLPVRILERALPGTDEKAITLLYGYPTDNIVVITTDQVALKAVYDTIISQQ